jgi:hydroxymethylpyrimidine/phosphomethylpyrimidine kinase
MSTTLPPRILIIAGSDSGGGAGIQADIKTVTALGGYAMTAITAATVQDTTGVHGFHPVPPQIVADQIRVTLADIGADAIKTGMLVSAAHVNAIADALEEIFSTLPLREGRNFARSGKFRGGDISQEESPLAEPGSAVHAASPRSTLPQGEGWIPLVVDTVMIAKGGTALLDQAGVDAMKRRLFPLAALITPNAPEAAALAGITINTPDDAARAGAMLREQGAHAVLVKGGHLSGDTVTDMLVDQSGVHRFTSARLDNPSTHGTGCTLASAIATGLARGLTLRDSVERGRAFVQEAIRTGLSFGHGTGPVNHLHGKK